MGITTLEFYYQHTLNTIKKGIPNSIPFLIVMI